MSRASHFKGDNPPEFTESPSSRPPLTADPFRRTALGLEGRVNSQEPLLPLQKTRGWFPDTTTFNSSPRGSDDFLCPPWAPGTQVQTHTSRQTCILMKEIKTSFKSFLKMSATWLQGHLTVTNLTGKPEWTRLSRPSTEKLLTAGILNGTGSAESQQKASRREWYIHQPRTL